MPIPLDDDAVFKTKGIAGPPVACCGASVADKLRDLCRALQEGLRSAGRGKEVFVGAFLEILCDFFEMF